MAVNHNKDSCNSCLYFSLGERIGTCKRYPDTKNKSGDDWCGEHFAIHVEAVKSMAENIVIEFTEPAKRRGRPKNVKALA